MKAEAATKHNPAQAEELKAIWELTDLQLRKANYHAARFRRAGIAAGVGVPLLYLGWLRSKRQEKKHG